MMNDQPYSVYIKRQKDEYGTKKDAEKKERVCYGFWFISNRHFQVCSASVLPRDTCLSVEINNRGI